jgi:putative flippase GtrA
MSRLFEALSPSRLTGRLARFSIVGALSTAGYFLLTNGAVALGTNATTASVVVYLALMPLSFLGHRHVTFASRGRSLREWARFCFVHVFNIAGVYAISRILVDGQGAPPWLAFLLISAFVPAVNFVAFQLWVFSPRSPGIKHDFV